MGNLSIQIRCFGAQSALARRVAGGLWIQPANRYVESPRLFAENGLLLRKSPRLSAKACEKTRRPALFALTFLAISQNISTFACRLLSKCLKRVRGRVLIAEFHWPKIGG